MHLSGPSTDGARGEACQRRSRSMPCSPRRGGSSLAATAHPDARGIRRPHCPLQGRAWQNGGRARERGHEPRFSFLCSSALEGAGSRSRRPRTASGGKGSCGKRHRGQVVDHEGQPLRTPEHQRHEGKAGRPPRWDGMGKKLVGHGSRWQISPRSTQRRPPGSNTGPRDRPLRESPPP